MVIGLWKLCTFYSGNLWASKQVGPEPNKIYTSMNAHIQGKRWKSVLMFNYVGILLAILLADSNLNEGAVPPVTFGKTSQPSWYKYNHFVLNVTDLLLYFGWKCLVF